MTRMFRFKETVIEVELEREATFDGYEQFGTFVCPVCKRMGYLAYGKDAEGKEREDFCIECGQRVRYRIPESLKEAK